MVLGSQRVGGCPTRGCSVAAHLHMILPSDFYISASLLAYFTV